MGHLVNPNSMRLGWFNGWADVWYSDSLYYTDYFFSILKLRLFLVFFLGSRFMEKTGLFYSHFSIYQSTNSFLVNIFVYDGKLEGFVDDFFFWHKLKMRSLTSKGARLTPGVYPQSWKILAVFSCFSPLCFYAYQP